MSDQYAIGDLKGKIVAERFEILDILGRGGMGTVYLARQLSVDRDVALKVMRQDIAELNTAADRFLREAKATSRLKNNHTVTVFDFGQADDGILFLAMEHLEGRTLRSKIDDDGALNLDDSIRIMSEMALSLSEAHSLGIVHRDIKPENIFLARQMEHPEFVKVLDFGIAMAKSVDAQTLTSTGGVVGTSSYLSPEAIEGKELDARTDVYAMGLCLYEMLTGEAAFGGPTPFTVMQKHLTEKPTPLVELLGPEKVPEMMSRFVERCMHRDREKRPADAGKLREQLSSLLIGTDETFEANQLQVTRPGKKAPPAVVEASGTGRTAAFLLLCAAVLSVGYWVIAGSSDFEEAETAPLTVPEVKKSAPSRQPNAKAAIAPQQPAAKSQPAAKAQPASPAVVQPASPAVVQPKTATITFVSKPLGAAVLHKGVSWGNTPVTRSFPVDQELNLRFQLEKHVPLDISFVTKEDRQVFRTLSPIPTPPKPTKKKSTKRPAVTPKSSPKVSAKPAPTTPAPQPRPTPKVKPKAKAVDDLLLGD